MQWGQLHGEQGGLRAQNEQPRAWRRGEIRQIYSYHGAEQQRGAAGRPKETRTPSLSVLPTTTSAKRGGANGIWNGLPWRSPCGTPADLDRCRGHRRGLHDADRCTRGSGAVRGTPKRKDSNTARDQAKQRLGALQSRPARVRVSQLEGQAARSARDLLVCDVNSLICIMHHNPCRQG